MKQLFTLCFALMGVTAMAQVPTLPYNSDWNNNGIIETVDLMQLLSDFGELFSSAVVSEDEESAIVYLGDMSYPVCATSCKSLPGVWRISDFEDIGLVWEEMQVNNRKTWLDYRYEGINALGANTAYFPYVYGNNYEASIDVRFTTAPGSPHRCYCASKQMPRVEYFLCSTNTPDNMKSCVDSKVSEGWQPLGSPYWANDSGNYWNQALWRWAE